jgi:DNA (cytosine-5)-methyltransferase 1
MKKFFNYSPTDQVKTYVIDLFCGAGGTSTAIYESNTNIQVIACINHDANAIRSHSENYPDCIHYTEDIRTVSLMDLKRIVDHLRLENPTCRIAIWASLECTHFSKAKGGQSRSADSRTLAEHLYRYDDIIQPDFFWIENVREFLTWGPLDDDGKPIKDYKGCDYQKWVNEFTGRGYSYDYRILNAADFGAYTSRVRYFGQFSKNPDAIAWPEQTHYKKPAAGQESWKAVKDILNLSNEGVSIFARKKDLSEATLERIYAGLVKFVANGDDSFLCSYYKNSTFIGPKDPCGTLTTKDRFQKVNVNFIDNQYGNSKPTSADQPVGSLTANPKQNVVTCRPWILNPQYVSKGSSLEKPCFTLIARMDKAPPYLVSPQKGNPFIKMRSTDTSAMKKIKLFMIAYGIADIKMRMLEIVEMLQIQGFPKDYILRGTQTDQKKYIGNSVEVTVGAALFRAIDKQINSSFLFAA